MLGPLTAPVLEIPAIATVNNAATLTTLSSCCERSLCLTPGHWIAVNKSTASTLITDWGTPSPGTLRDTTSPNAIADAATAAEQLSQSVHPIKNPGYSPMARRANT